MVALQVIVRKFASSMDGSGEAPQPAAWHSSCFLGLHCRCPRDLPWGCSWLFGAPDPVQFCPPTRDLRTPSKQLEPTEDPATAVSWPLACVVHRGMHKESQATLSYFSGWRVSFTNVGFLICA